MENLNRTYTKDEAFKVLDLFNESIKHTDNKSAILVGLITLLIGLTTKVFEAVNIISNWNNIYNARTKTNKSARNIFYKSRN